MGNLGDIFHANAAIKSTLNFAFTIPDYFAILTISSLAHLKCPFFGLLRCWRISILTNRIGISTFASFEKSRLRKDYFNNSAFD